jgi:hypothetical protein
MSSLAITMSTGPNLAFRHSTSQPVQTQSTIALFFNSKVIASNRTLLGIFITLSYFEFN